MAFQNQIEKPISEPLPLSSLPAAHPQKDLRKEKAYDWAHFLKYAQS